MKHSCSLMFLLGMYSFSAGAAENSPSPAADPVSKVESSRYSYTLLGDWGGSRRTMSAHGYDWEIVYKLDVLGRVSQPNPKSYALDNLDIILSLDGEKIFGFKGTSAMLHILSNHGDKPAVDGDRLPHGVDNIETPVGANTTKIYQAGIQQTFLDDQMSVLVGLYDLNSEFYVTESSKIFIHPTFGIGAEMASTGQNGPSVFPTTSFAIRAKAETAGYYLQAVVLDGVPGDPNNLQGTHVEFNKGDGTLQVIEGAIPLSVSENAHNNKLALGVWQYTARFDDWVDKDIYGNPAKSRMSGYYAVIDKVLRYKPGSNDESINGFIRFGKTNADADPSEFDAALSTGLLFSGLFDGHEGDQLGIAFAQERNGAKYLAASGNTVANEKSFELSYRYLATPGLVLQPMAQYLLNHGNDPAQNKTWWLGMRFEVTF
jgi:porin